MSTGNFLEDKIIQTNRKYRKQGFAIIEKIPNDFRIIRKKGQIAGARPRGKVSVDFIGMQRVDIYPYPTAFECKETENKNEFPLFIHKKRMVKEHQQKFLEDWNENGGEGFYLIYFKTLKILFKVKVPFVGEMYRQAEKEGRKTVKYDEFVASKECKEVSLSNYLEIEDFQDE